MQKTRIEKLEARAAQAAQPALVLSKATDEDYTAEQEAQIAQAEAEGREVQVIEWLVVVCCPVCNGPVPRAGGRRIRPLQAIRRNLSTAEGPL